VAALLLADGAVKVLLPTPWWGWHHGTLGGPVAALGLPIVASGLVWRWARWTRWAAAVTLAGALGNMLWLANPRGVANPLVYNRTAFNLADVMIVAGMAALPACVCAFAYSNRRSRARTRPSGHT
jgi:hypothetical protein